jgi:hypothetical protein
MDNHSMTWENRFYLKPYCTASRPRPACGEQKNSTRGSTPSAEQAGARLTGQVEMSKNDSDASCVEPGLQRSPLSAGSVVLHTVRRYNHLMNRSAAEILEDARQLPPGDLDWLVRKLLEEAEGTPEEEKAFAAWQKDVGEPEPGYEEWFRAGVEEALADTSGDVPHEEAMKQFHNAILRARKLKATA